MFPILTEINIYVCIRAVMCLFANAYANMSTYNTSPVFHVVLMLIVVVITSFDIAIVINISEVEIQFKLVLTSSASEESNILLDFAFSSFLSVSFK